MPLVLQADYTLFRGRFEADLAVTVEGEQILSVGPPPPGAEVVRLSRRALLPGMVNAHSHAFQRAIRGRTEFRSGDRDSFWTWRERMYAAAAGLDPEGLQAVSAMAFMEMALAGITSVGEFHYLHRRPDGGCYEDPDELALQVVEGARRAGLGLVLLRVAYARGGWDRSASPHQARFLDASPEDCLAAAERLASRGIAVGLAPHSVRAVPLEWILTLREASRERGLPFHMHLSEQPREIEECLAEHGVRPVELLAREGVLGRDFTAVHAIHLEEQEKEALAGSLICSCPTTERNLGDGVLPAHDLLRRGCRLCLGSDSQCQIDLLEDARELEYHLRLWTLSRNVLPPLPEGLPSERLPRDPQMPALFLWCAASLNGAAALGLKTGDIRPGWRADLLALDLDDPSIAGADRESLLAAIVFGLERTAVREVWVGGRQVVVEGRHLQQESITRQFQAAMRRLWS